MSQLLASITTGKITEHGDGSHGCKHIDLWAMERRKKDQQREHAGVLQEAQGNICHILCHSTTSAPCNVVEKGHWFSITLRLSSYLKTINVKVSVNEMAHELN